MKATKIYSSLKQANKTYSMMKNVKILYSYKEVTNRVNEELQSIQKKEDMEMQLIEMESWYTKDLVLEVIVDRKKKIHTEIEELLGHQLQKKQTGME
ncbi:33261_t:CDS:2, partial [Gigaspora margarita]